MALGVQKLFHADYGLSVTGIAGPTGGTPEKPVGLVYMGLATPDGVETRRHQFPGDREMVKVLTAETALDWLRREMLRAIDLSDHGYTATTAGPPGTRVLAQINRGWPGI